MKYTVYYYVNIPILFAKSCHLAATYTVPPTNRVTFFVFDEAITKPCTTICEEHGAYYSDRLVRYAVYGQPISENILRPYAIIS